MFKKSLLFELVYNCMMYKSFTCQNIMLKLPDSITVTAVMYRYGWLSIMLQMKKKMLHFKKKSFVIGFVS